MSHARLSCSGSPTWANCAGSVAAQEGIPDRPTEPAQRGTCVHWVVDQSMRFNTPAEVYEDKTLFLSGDDVYVRTSTANHVFEPHTAEDLELQGHLWTVTRDMVEQAQATLDLADQLVKELPGSVIVKSETKLNPGELINRDDCWGTGDIILLTDTHFSIYDLKTGYILVPATGNYQLILYAIGVLASLPIDHRARIETITLGIIQPVQHNPNSHGLDEITMSIEDLWAWVYFFTAAAKATDAPDAPLTPGEIQCKWCKAKPACPALRGSMLNNLAEITEADDTPEKQLTKLETSMLREPEDLPLEDMITLLDMIPMARDWLSAVESYATERVLSGNAIPGYKLVYGRSNKRWKEDNESVIKKISINYKVPRKDVCKPPVPLAPTAMEQLIRKNWKENGKVLEGRKEKNFFDLFEKPKGEPTLVPNSDPRSAIATTGEEMFEGLPEPSLD